MYTKNKEASYNFWLGFALIYFACCSYIFLIKTNNSGVGLKIWHLCDLFDGQTSWEEYQTLLNVSYGVILHWANFILCCTPQI